VPSLPAVLVVWLAPPTPSMLALALGLVIGGAVGNGITGSPTAGGGSCLPHPTATWSFVVRIQPADVASLPA